MSLCYCNFIWCLFTRKKWLISISEELWSILNNEGDWTWTSSVNWRATPPRNVLEVIFWKPFISTPFFFSSLDKRAVMTSVSRGLRTICISPKRYTKSLIAVKSYVSKIGKKNNTMHFIENLEYVLSIFSLTLKVTNWKRPLKEITQFVAHMATAVEIRYRTLLQQML